MNNETNFLAENVFPHLNAVEAGLLDDLKPVSQSSGQSYALKCPDCGKFGRAFYYPGGLIRCNRRNECGAVISVFDYLMRSHGSRREVFEILCRAVGVEPPKGDQPAQETIYSAFRKVTQGYFVGRVRARFSEWRGYSDNDLSQMQLGYFPDSRQITKDLIAAGFKLQEVAESGLVAKQGEEDRFAGRVIGYWRLPGGRLGYWGRRFDDVAKDTPKYLFSTGLKKSIPYQFRNGSDVILLEGPLDCHALRLLSYNAQATGGAYLIRSQAQFLVSHGVTEITYVTDGDEAGYEGIIRTVCNARQCGITPKFVILPRGADDPDSMRRNGRVEELKRLLGKPLSDGQALGHLYAHYSLTDSSKNPALASQIRKLRTMLTADGRRDFDLTLAGHGFELNLEAEALSLASHLLEVMSLNQANELIAKRFGFKIEVVNVGAA